MIMRRSATSAPLLVCLWAMSCFSSVCAAQPDVLWGVNGHPLTAYKGVSLAEQLDLARTLGVKSYRVDVNDSRATDKLAELITLARARGIDILPVLTPIFDLDATDPKTLYARAFDFAATLVRKFGADIRTWELGNEMESYAIIKACEMRDDGTQYNCAWGPAGGVEPLDYYGPRWAKVSAVLKGMSDGTVSVDPQIRKAMGTAGWGHLGAFDRMHADGIRWDISVWHSYGQDPEWGFKSIARFKKPIWVTEFNHPMGSQESEAAQGPGLEKAMRRFRELRAAYKVEAAHIYELLDETYWAPDFEAYMGLVRLVPDGQGAWRPGAPKPAFETVRELLHGGLERAVAATQPATAVQPVRANACNAPVTTRRGTPEQQVEHGYCLVLGRSADGAGSIGYAKALAAGTTVDQFLVGLIVSEEFESAGRVGHAPQRDYVTLLYRTLLGREPDGAGLSGYVEALEKSAMKRVDVARMMIASAEFRQRHPVLFGAQ
jgi:hypothetical protein